MLTQVMAIALWATVTNMHHLLWSTIQNWCSTTHASVVTVDAVHIQDNFSVSIFHWIFSRPYRGNQNDSHYMHAQYNTADSSGEHGIAHWQYPNQFHPSRDGCSDKFSDIQLTQLGA